MRRLSAGRQRQGKFRGTTITQSLSAERLERMHTVLGGYIDRGEMPGLVALVSRGETVHVEALGALSFGGTSMKRDLDLPHRLDDEAHYLCGRDDPG
jgi:hypothetical protein